MEHVECGSEDQIGRIEYLARQLQALAAAARACSLAPSLASDAAATSRLLDSARRCNPSIGRRRCRAPAPQHRLPRLPRMTTRPLIWKANADLLLIICAVIRGKRRMGGRVHGGRVEKAR